jgi:predicted phosphodiesterase
MRYGLISDVHANLSALQASLELLRRAEVNAYICAGDIVGYGPHPNECVDVVAGLPGVCVAGNHDLIALDRLSCEGIGDLARLTLEWTRSELTSDSRTWLGSLQRTVATGPIVVTHGSLDDPRRYVTTDDLASDELAGLATRSPGAGLLVLGHTHRSLAFGEVSGRVLDGAAGSVDLGRAERWVVNPGAVGQSRDRSIRARVAVLDLTARSVNFHSLPYDVDATLLALRRAGLPPAAVRLHTGRRSVRSAIRRVFSALASRRG